MERLSAYRKRLGLTQAELASQAGIRQATLSALENGRSLPRNHTVLSLAKVLKVEPDTIRTAIQNTQSQVAGEGMNALDMMKQIQHDWSFFEGLDRDLRSGLAQWLIAEWTHTSTALEGNTITAGDTLFVLKEGLTVSGKSLREHQEIHGHAQALSLMAGWVRARHPVRIESLHQLHRAVQTGAEIDVFNPVGAWKVEPNGSMASPSSGKPQWHEYAHPRDVPILVETWLSSLAGTRQKTSTKRDLLDSYTDTHLGFVGIHPYSDGNGRMARLLANIPILRAGMPPLLVSIEQRREYLTLLGDYSLDLGQPTLAETIVKEGKSRDALRDFFESQWKTTLDQVEGFHQRQRSRE